MHTPEEAEGLKRGKSRNAAKWAALGIILILVSAFVLYSAGGVEWKIERITGTSGIVHWPFVATDNTGSLHMTYYSGGSLVHAVQTDHGWERSTIVTDSIWGASPLVFGPTGRPHVCYQVWGGESSFYNSNYTLVHAEEVDDYWQKSIISNSSYKGSHSIAVDASDKAHAAFLRADDLVYACNTSGHWDETVLVDHPEPPIWYHEHAGRTSMAIDGSGHPHVAAGLNGGFVGIFSESEGLWNLTTFFNWDITYDSVSIAVHENGKIFVSYWGYPLGGPYKYGLMLATRDSSTWDVISIHPMPNINIFSFNCAVSIDADGQPRVAMEERGNTGSSLAVLVQSGAAWKYCTVIDSGELLVPGMSQLSICSNGEGHTVVPVSRGFAEYATDSPSLFDRLHSVIPLAAASYIAGLLVWAVVIGVLRVISRRTHGRKEEAFER